MFYPCERDHKGSLSPTVSAIAMWSGFRSARAVFSSSSTAPRRKTSKGPNPPVGPFDILGRRHSHPHRLSAVTGVPRYASTMDLIDVLVWPGGAGIAAAPVLRVGSRLDLSLPVPHQPNEPDTADALD